MAYLIPILIAAVFCVAAEQCKTQGFRFGVGKMARVYYALAIAFSLVAMAQYMHAP
jgi:hypothetical protein